MNKIKCTICGEELESKHLNDLVKCSCKNKAYANGGDIYQEIGAKDITKIRIWDEENGAYRKATL